MYCCLFCHLEMKPCHVQASSMKRQKSGTETNDSLCSSSDSNTFYEDDFSSSTDETSEDGLEGRIFVWSVWLLHPFVL